MTKEIRCPYCIAAGFGFRLMAKNQLREKEYECRNCGHVSSRDKLGFRCMCARCSEVAAQLTTSATDYQVDPR